MFLALALVVLSAGKDNGPPAVAAGYTLTPQAAPWKFPAAVTTKPVSLPDPPPRQWILLSTEPGVEALGRLENGYVVDIEARRRVTDPYGFGYYLNTVFGRGDMVYDPTLDTWAAQNNAACLAKYSQGPPSRKGLWPDLHHVYHPRGSSCAGWNYASVEAVAQGWYGSLAHRLAIQNRGMTRYGIAWGPGPYWSLQMLR